MRTVLIASLRHHTRRYVAAGVAVVIGVAFVVVTGMLTGAMRSGLTADIGAPVAGVDHVVSVDDPRTVGRLMTGAAEAGVPALALGYAMEPLARDGVQLAASADVAQASLDPALQWQELVRGRHPESPTEALADAEAAEDHGVRLGDVLEVGTGDATAEVEVVGLVDTPPALTTDLYVPWSTLERFDDTFWADAVAWGGTEAQARELAPGMAVAPSQTWVDDQHAQISRGVDVIATMALLFVAIALFVGVMVIANTFAILFAQRLRDFALLRCVGVTRRQLRRAVRLEALVIGVAAATVGLVVGAVVGVGLVALVRVWFADMGDPALDPRWAGAGFVVGVVATVLAAWLPTRSSTRVPPLAALRPDTGVDVRSTAGRRRLAAAAVCLVAGTALLAAAVAAHDLALMLGGGVLSFLGVLLVGPVLVPGVIGVVGRVLGDGPVRRLATGNAVRNPRRTATTAASLLVGVTLTTAVLTGLASSRTGIEREMDRSHPIDGSITAVEQPLEPAVRDRAAALEGVADAVLLDGTFATIGRTAVPLLGVGSRPSVLRGPDDLAPADGVVLLPHSVVEELPRPVARKLGRDEEVTVSVAGRPHTLRVELGYGWGRTGIVSADTLAALDPGARPTALWVRAADGADAETLTDDLAALAGSVGAEVDGGYAERRWVDLQVDILTGTVVGLLAITVVIALVGIANTLGLSVLERGRENALLRAMGLTRPQLRHAMATEGLLLAGVATLLGTALGLAYAWVGVKVLVDAAIDGVDVTVPVGQVAAVALVAGIAGVAASVVPARRAAAVTPAAGLALD